MSHQSNFRAQTSYSDVHAYGYHIPHRGGIGGVNGDFMHHSSLTRSVDGSLPRSSFKDYLYYVLIAAEHDAARQVQGPRPRGAEGLGFASVASSRSSFLSRAGNSALGSGGAAAVHPGMRGAGVAYHFGRGPTQADQSTSTIPGGSSMLGSDIRSLRMQLEDPAPGKERRERPLMGSMEAQGVGASRGVPVGDGLSTGVAANGTSGKAHRPVYRHRRRGRGSIRSRTSSYRRSRHAVGRVGSTVPPSAALRPPTGSSSDADSEGSSRRSGGPGQPARSGTRADRDAYTGSGGGVPTSRWLVGGGGGPRPSVVQLERENESLRRQLQRLLEDSASVGGRSQYQGLRAAGGYSFQQATVAAPQPLGPAPLSQLHQPEEGQGGNAQGVTTHSGAARPAGTSGKGSRQQPALPSSPSAVDTAMARMQRDVDAVQGLIGRLEDRLRREDGGPSSEHQQEHIDVNRRLQQLRQLKGQVEDRHLGRIASMLAGGAGEAGKGEKEVGSEGQRKGDSATDATTAAAPTAVVSPGSPPPDIASYRESMAPQLARSTSVPASPSPSPAKARVRVRLDGLLLASAVGKIQVLLCLYANGRPLTRAAAVSCSAHPVAMGLSLRPPSDWRSRAGTEQGYAAIADLGNTLAEGSSAALGYLQRLLWAPTEGGSDAAAPEASPREVDSEARAGQVVRVPVGATLVLPAVSPQEGCVLMLEVQQRQDAVVAGSGAAYPATESLGWCVVPLFRPYPIGLAASLNADAVPPSFEIAGGDGSGGAAGSEPGVTSRDLEVATGKTQLPLAPLPIGRPHGLTLPSMRAAIQAGRRVPETHVFLSVFQEAMRRGDGANDAAAPPVVSLPALVRDEAPGPALDPALVLAAAERDAMEATLSLAAPGSYTAPLGPLDVRTDLRSRHEMIGGETHSYGAGPAPRYGSGNGESSRHSAEPRVQLTSTAIRGAEDTISEEGAPYRPAPPPPPRARVPEASHGEQSYYDYSASAGSHYNAPSRGTPAYHVSSAIGQSGSAEMPAADRPPFSSAQSGAGSDSGAHSVGTRMEVPPAGIPAELAKYPPHIEALPTVDDAGDHGHPPGDHPWVRTVLPSTFRQPMAADDGFDVYVDAARFLPDNVSVSRVVCKVMDPTFAVVGQEFGSGAALDSDTLSPRFDAYGAFRLPSASRVDSGRAALPGIVRDSSTGPGRWHPHLTLVIRVDTLESHTHTPAVAGYALLNLFAQPGALGAGGTDDKGPAAAYFPYNLLLPRPDATAGSYMLNAGGFYLPLFQGPPRKDKAPLSADSLVGAATARVPCSTILVRVRKAPRSPSKGTVLSREDVPAAQWCAVGLREPPRRYGAPLAYDSTRCLPFAAEVKLYPKRADLTSPTVRDTLQGLEQDAREGSPAMVGLPAFPTISNDASLQQWMNRALQGPPRSMLDFGYLAPFDPEAGLYLSVDSVVGGRQAAAGVVAGGRVTSPGGVVYAVLHCLASRQGPVLAHETLPPSGWHAARHPDWGSTLGKQALRDGYSSYYSVRFDPKMCIFLLVKGVRVPTSAEAMAAMASRPPAPETVGWAVLPVFDRRCEGYVRRGAFQLPVFVGSPPPQLWGALQEAPEVDAVLHSLPEGGGTAGGGRRGLSGQARLHPDGISVAVRLQDPQFGEMLEVGGGPSQELVSPGLRARVAEAAQQAAAAGGGQTLRELLPRGTTEQQANKLVLRSLRTIVGHRMRGAARAVQAAVREYRGRGGGGGKYR